MAGTATAQKVETAATIDPVVEKDEFGDAFSMFAKDEKPSGESASTVKAVEAEPAPVVVGADGKAVTKVEEPEIKTEIEGAPVEGETAEQKTAREASEAAAAAAAKAKDIVIGKPDGGATDDKTSDVLERLVDVLTTRQTSNTSGDNKAATEAPLYNAQELGVLQEFAKEWPEVATANAILMNGLAKSIESRIYREIALGMAPHIKKLEVLANNSQYDALDRSVPGYDQVMDKVGEWVNKESVGYLKKARLGVIDGGTIDEVKHLVSEYRAATGDKTGLPDETQQQTETKDTTLSTTAKKAAVRLAPVVSKASGAVAGAPQTFEDGFAHALKLLA